MNLAELFDWAEAHAKRTSPLELSTNELALLAASGFEKLWRALEADKAALPDAVSRRTEREQVNSIIEGESLPGWERPRDYWDESARRGFRDEWDV